MSKADELKKAEEERKQADILAAKNKEVILTQEKLDTMLDEVFKRGASRSDEAVMKNLGVESIEQVKELLKAKKDSDEAAKSDNEKQAESIVLLEKTIKGLELGNKELKADMALERVASTNGIKDVDYFKHLIGNAAKDDKFNQETFLETLKTTKPYLFGEAIKPKIDNSPNKTPKDFSEKVASAKTMAELYALQGEGTK